MILILNTRLFYNKIVFISIFLSIIILINICFFFDIYSSSELSFYFIDKTHTFPAHITNILKIVYILSISITWSFILNLAYKNMIDRKIFELNSNPKNYINSNSLIIGKNIENNSIISIPEKGLYQNMLITRHYWYWQNIICHVSLHKAINSNGLWHANTRCER